MAKTNAKMVIKVIMHWHFVIHLPINLNHDEYLNTKKSILHQNDSVFWFCFGVDLSPLGILPTTTNNLHQMHKLTIQQVKHFINKTMLRWIDDSWAIIMFIIIFGIWWKESISLFCLMCNYRCPSKINNASIRSIENVWSG